MFSSLARAMFLSSESETITFPEPSNSRDASMFFVATNVGGNDEGENTSLVEICPSSSDDKLYLFNRKRLFTCKKSDTQTEIPVRVQANLKVDWESEILNEISQQQRHVRACCDFAVQIKTTPNFQYDQIYPCLINNWNFEDLSPESFQIFKEESNFKCLGFIDGKLVRSQYWDGNTEIYMEENSVTKDGMKKLELSEWNSSTANILPIPCENFKDRKYALNALLGTNNKSYFFQLFNLKEQKFEKFTLKDLTLLSDFELDSPRTEVIIREGDQLRVFMLIQQSLYELRWENGELVVVNHLVWLRQDIQSIIKLDQSLLVVATNGTFIYQPSMYDVDAEKGTLAAVKIPENSAHKLLWQNNCLINALDLINELPDYIILTSEAILKLESKPISECYSKEELLKQYQFKNYVPPKITDAFTVKNCKSDDEFRGDTIYECKRDRYNDMEIIAGIKCRDEMRLSFAISEQYKELNPDEMADYLGAPIMISSFNNFTLGYIHDMHGKKRDSQYVLVKAGFFTTSFDLRGTTFLAVLSPKDTVTSEVSEVNVGNREWKDLATNKQFRVESDKIRVADYSTRGYVEIDNVESGIWSYNQQLENELPAQLIAYNQNYRDSVNQDIENDWNVPDGTFSEKLVNSYSISEQTSQTRQLTDDWQVSVCGICVDGGLVGIFDAGHYKDDKIFNFEKKGFDIHFPSENKDWSGQLRDMMNDQGYPLLMNVPFGIISRDAETGDGTYACLSKVYNGKVVAVKVIIQHSAYP